VSEYFEMANQVQKKKIKNNKGQKKVYFEHAIGAAVE
jgi:hypothetical protein